MKRRHFLADTCIAIAGAKTFLALANKEYIVSIFANDASDFELSEKTISELQQAMKEGKLSSERITRLYLKRIEELDKNGPAIHAVIEINPDAIPIARKMDAERKAGKIRSALHGIPVLIKDNIDTSDQMMTTAGSIALLNHKAAKDAYLVGKLREAGAILLGKTNLSEWANFRSTRSSSGWSSRGGQTRNPYVLDRSPCGSSSGSAAAVAANFCAVAIGTETDGSIACPSSMNGIVGIKPTVELVSRKGIIPISKTQDTAGPMARTVADAAMLLNVISGFDTEDEAAAKYQHQPILDYTHYLNLNGLKGKRIGVEKKFLHGHESIDLLFKKALQQMESNGAVLVELEFIDPFNAIKVEEELVLEYEFKDGLNTYLSTANAKVHSLRDVIDFNKRNESQSMPYFKQEILEKAEEKGDLNSKPYLNAMMKYEEARKFYTTFFEANKLQAFCGPANGLPWCTDLVNGDFYTGYGVYGPAAVCGYPSITIPMGAVHNLQAGISFIGVAFSEGELISIGFAYEQISKNRTVPKFLKTFSNK